MSSSPSSESETASQPLSPSRIFDALAAKTIFPVKLVDILKGPLPPCPPMKSATTASSTRGATQADFKLAPKRQLMQTVLYPRMLTDLLKSSLEGLESVSLQNPAKLTDMLWMSQIHPGCPTVSLPSPISSEQDSTQWIQRVLVAPCCWLLQARHGVRFSGCQPNPNDGPVVHFTSALKGSVIPDGVISISKGDKSINVLTMEFKTRNAMDVDLCERLCKVKDDREPPARPFYWPHPGTLKDAGDDPKQSKKLMKLLVQVWTQMITHQVTHAILSSYETTICFMRSPKFPNTLYHSPLMEVKGDAPDWVVLQLTAFLEHALKLTDTTIKLPKPYTSWWTPAMRNRQGRRPGLDLHSELSSKRLLPRSERRPGLRPSPRQKQHAGARKAEAEAEIEGDE